MKILKLTLQNFKGIRSFQLDTQGQDINAFGDNETGKTTLADAFMWLLFNKDSQNRSDFEIKELDKDGNVKQHGLDHSVEAILELPDGQQLALKKVYSEKWTKKRGSATAEFTGHTTDHFIDGVPAQKKEYDARIAEIADENIFRLLTDPRYFNEILHWQKRRELLLEVCGDVSDEEVINSAVTIGNKDMLSLLTVLNAGRTLDQHRKVIQARRTKINQELEKIPVRIDEVKRSLPDISDINEKELPNDIAKLRDELRTKQEELAQTKAGGQTAEKTKQLREIEGQILDLRNKHREVLDEKVAGKRSEHQWLLCELNDLKGTVSAKENSIKYSLQEIKSLDEKMEKLRSDWRIANEQQFEFAQEETCPTCGQALPQEQLQEARDKALANYNKAKAERLETINAEGKRLAARKAELIEKNIQTRDELDMAKAELSELEQKEAALKGEIDSIMQGAEPVESTDEYYQLNAKYRDIQDEIRKLEADNSLAVAAIQKEIDTLSDAIKALEQTQARIDAHKSSERRIDELKAEERKLAAEFEELESQLYLTEEFIRAKVRLLEEKINSKFQMARFKLFEVQVNGALAECCETTYKGVPYTSNLNNGAKINVGLDIINTLAEHYGFAPVAFIDNAESVTDILQTRGQQIRLVVSAADKKLRVEIVSARAQAIA